jgi:hypothetical protein
MPDGYELVRVNREMVERLIADPSAPAVVIALERLDDGTCEMWLQTTDTMVENRELRRAASDLRAAGDKLAEAVRERWSGDGLCCCACCTAARGWAEISEAAALPSTQEPR